MLTEGSTAPAEATGDVVAAAYLSRILRDAGENLDEVSLSRAITYGRDTGPGPSRG